MLGACMLRPAWYILAEMRPAQWVTFTEHLGLLLRDMYSSFMQCSNYTNIEYAYYFQQAIRVIAS